MNEGSVFLRNLSGVLIFFLGAVGIVFAVHERLVHAFLEDDMLWFLPLLVQMMERFSLWAFVEQLHTAELTLVDGVYFSFLLSVFGPRFTLFTWFSILFHLLNTVLLFVLLKWYLRLSAGGSLTAPLIYLTFYGHFHAYTFLMASHHLMVVFFFLLVLCCYLETDRRIEAGRPFFLIYGFTLLVCLPAVIQRLSILILPFMILAHLIYTTTTKEKVIFKFKLWTPLLSVFFIYQIIVFLAGTHGDVLDGFLEPLYGAFMPGQITFLKVVIVAVVVLLLLSAAGMFLKSYLARRPLEWIQGTVFYGACFTVFLPFLLTLCLCLFIFPMDSALGGADIWERWHRLENPVKGTSLYVAYGLVVAIIAAGLKWLRRRCPHLIVMFVWYVFVVLYLGGYKEEIPSRYLIYLAPVFAIFFCIFFVELIPSNVKSPTLRKGYFSGLAVLLVCLLGWNLLSIKVRSLKTLLTDYRWSYDYIKVAELIYDDIQGRLARNDPMPDRVCVSGLQHIPYAAHWKEGFLKNFSFERFDSFRQILSSRFRGEKPSLNFNGECSEGQPHYKVDDGTVTLDGKSIDLFQGFLTQGLQALREGNLGQARIALERAVQERPFVLRFIGMPLFADQSSWAVFIRANLAEAVYGVYAVSYDMDQKIQYIDTVIRREVYDYGLALTLLAYFNKSDNPFVSDRFLEEAAVYVTRDGLVRYLNERDIDFPGSEEFRDFFTNREGAHLMARREVPWQDVEYDDGFKIFLYDKIYFAQPIDMEYLDLAAYKSHLCPQCFSARTKRELREKIDPYRRSSARAPEGHGLKAMGEGGEVFSITQRDDVYDVLAQQKDISLLGGKDWDRGNPIFRCQTFWEASETVRLAGGLALNKHMDFPPQIRRWDDGYPTHFPSPLEYRLSWMHVPLGKMSFEHVPSSNEGSKGGTVQAKIKLRPWQWICRLSSNRAIIDFAAVIDAVSFLPHTYEQIDLRSLKKGKAPRSIVYHHEGLYMERKGRQEDILADTRDYVSVFYWLMSQEYNHKRWIKTTLNINRNLYLVVGQSYPLGQSDQWDSVLVDMKIRKFDPEGVSSRDGDLKVYLVKEGGMYIPVFVFFHKDLIFFQLERVLSQPERELTN